MGRQTHLPRTPTAFARRPDDSQIGTLDEMSQIRPFSTIRACVAAGQGWNVTADEIRTLCDNLDHDVFHVASRSHALGQMLHQDGRAMWDLFLPALYRQDAFGKSPLYHYLLEVDSRREMDTSYPIDTFLHRADGETSFLECCLQHGEAAKLRHHTLPLNAVAVATTLEYLKTHKDIDEPTLRSARHIVLLNWATQLHQLRTDLDAGHPINTAPSCPLPNIRTEELTNIGRGAPATGKNSLIELLLACGENQKVWDIVAAHPEANLLQIPGHYGEYPAKFIRSPHLATEIALATGKENFWQVKKKARIAHVTELTHDAAPATHAYASNGLWQYLPDDWQTDPQLLRAATETGHNAIDLALEHGHLHTLPTAALEEKIDSGKFHNYTYAAIFLILDGYREKLANNHLGKFQQQFNNAYLNIIKPATSGEEKLKQATRTVLAKIAKDTLTTPPKAPALVR